MVPGRPWCNLSRCSSALETAAPLNNVLANIHPVWRSINHLTLQQWLNAFVTMRLDVYHPLSIRYRSFGLALQSPCTHLETELQIFCFCSSLHRLLNSWPSPRPSLSPTYSRISIISIFGRTAVNLQWVILESNRQWAGRIVLCSQVWLSRHVRGQLVSTAVIR